MVALQLILIDSTRACVRSPASTATENSALFRSCPGRPGELACLAVCLIDSVSLCVCVQDSYERAKALLKAHSGELKALADALMKHETLNGHDLQQLIKTGSLLHLEGDTSSPPFVK